MKYANALIVAIVVLSFAVAAWLYPAMPALMASHWDINGQVDGYLSKFWGVFLMPIIALAVWLLFLLIPRIDPLKNNLAKFRKYFDGLMVLLVLFLVYIYKFTILWSLGWQLEIRRWVAPALAILFFYLGVLLKHSHRTW